MDETSVQEVHSPYFDMHALVMYIVTRQQIHNIMEYQFCIHNYISACKLHACLTTLFDASTEAFLRVSLKS